MTFRSVVVEGHVQVQEADIWDDSKAIAERYIDKQFVERLMVRVRTQPRVLLVIHPDEWLSWDISENVLALEGWRPTGDRPRDPWSKSLGFRLIRRSLICKKGARPSAAAV